MERRDVAALHGAKEASLFPQPHQYWEEKKIIRMAQVHQGD